MKDAAWFRKDWSEKTFAKVYKDLVFNKWWTDTRGHTDDGGRFQIRGFLGTYELVITVGDQIRSQQFDLSSDGQTLTIDL